jgi:hypothetical protein
LVADHLIGDKIAFHQAIGEAEIMKKQGKW